MLDSVLIASKVVEYATKINIHGFVMKLYAKAYDKVDWEFLDYILMRKGFRLKWRKWIQGCLKTVN
ncbi:hypothetical protein Syun_013020 [Stephania yunnanensis]|uniref:Reverse transcriptase n=1 Tax=Stephania yunnanensis TaxID=152371 RepID=A0AAP0PJG4_9MAGN